MWKTRDMMNYIQQSIDDIPVTLTDIKPDENGHSEVYEVETTNMNHYTMLVKVITYNGDDSCEDKFLIKCFKVE